MKVMDLTLGINKRLVDLPVWLREHISRTREVAVNLAAHYQLDVAKCDLGASAHDLARHWNDQELLFRADKEQMSIDIVERSVPMLLHGPVAAAIVKFELGCSDPDVLNAIRFHTTGRAFMSEVEKVVFLADKIEPRKIRHSDILTAVEDVAYEDLNLAIQKYLSIRIRSIIQSGGLVHPLSIEAWNYFLGLHNVFEPSA